ncbi:jasmonate-induced protein homolog [Silene latifolia]|uniref:jasmonate-induced protein homolog n=1 Tax=Silene latifolia TaxID=37657 RepID=UPI003D77DAA8
MASNQVQKATNSKVQPQNGAHVSLTNQISREMKLDRSVSWSGGMVGSFPSTIAPGHPVTFSHLSDGDFGSRAAVVYTGTNMAGVDCAWVLAWDAPAYTEHAPNRVYAICGPKSVLDRLEFNQIRLSLGVSSSASEAEDNATKTSVNATIDESMPNKANVEATFTVIP